MKFNELAWAAVCFYYHSAGDKRYGSIMREKDFLSRLRQCPQTVTVKEFEAKAIDSYINLENKDLLVSRQLAEKILNKIVDIQPELASLSEVSLMECSLNDSLLLEAIAATYAELRAYGLWITGASKMAHLLNDRLFPLLSPPLARYFNITEEKGSIKSWLIKIQSEIREATSDFAQQKIPTSLELFLSSQVGYSKEGYNKSILKFADEYYWLKFADGLPVPPRWTPAVTQPAPNWA